MYAVNSEYIIECYTHLKVWGGGDWFPCTALAIFALVSWSVNKNGNNFTH